MACIRKIVGIILNANLLDTVDLETKKCMLHSNKARFCFLMHTFIFDWSASCITFILRLSVCCSDQTAFFVYVFKSFTLAPPPGRAVNYNVFRSIFLKIFSLFPVGLVKTFASRQLVKSAGQCLIWCHCCWHSENMTLTSKVRGENTLIHHHKPP